MRIRGEHISFFGKGRRNDSRVQCISATIINAYIIQLLLLHRLGNPILYFICLNYSTAAFNFVKRNTTAKPSEAWVSRMKVTRTPTGHLLFSDEISNLQESAAQ